MTTLDEIHKIIKKFLKLHDSLPSKIYLGKETRRILEHETGFAYLKTPDNKYIIGLAYEEVNKDYHIGVGFDMEDLECEEKQRYE